MAGFKAVILRGAGVDEIWLPATVLLGFAALFLALGTWRFRFE
jgi:ABC-type multidrug transport system permease subunit